jgi:hypothetical protein
MFGIQLVTTQAGLDSEPAHVAGLYQFGHAARTMQLLLYE